MTGSRPPLVLLPASKGKVEGGDGPAYGATLDVADHPLAAARAELLAAIAATAGDLDVAGLARLTGVPRGRAADQRAGLLGLSDAPTLPGHRRYSGVVHTNAGLPGMDPTSTDVEVVVISALLGALGMTEPTPAYRLELGGSLPGLGRLGTWWRRRAAGHLDDLAAGRRVWNLLPNEHARVWPHASRSDASVIEVRFVRPDGRAANAARTKVAKGRLTAALLADPSLTPATLHGSELLGAGWTLRADGDLVATWLGA